MVTIAAPIAPPDREPEILSGTPRAHAIDRWIFVFMAAWFIAIVLAGFIPSSLMKIEMVRSGMRPQFPLIMHVHAGLMGSFLLLLFAQTWLMATGRRAYHLRLGLLSLVLAPAIVIVGFVLAPTMYHQVWDSLQAAPLDARDRLQAALSRSENVKLLQIRVGILFPMFLAIALWARKQHPGLHKRMMVLATAIPLVAGIDRIPWLPGTLPTSPLSADLYVLLAISPMVLWDLIRNRRVHQAYWIWLAISLPVTITVHVLWDTPWWHAAVRQVLGV